MISFQMADRRRQRPNSTYFSASCWVLLVLMSFAASGQVLAQNQELTAEQSDTIHGTVVNAVTRAPIARALVYSPDRSYATLTDGEGHFEFMVPGSSGMAEGKIVLRAEGTIVSAAGGPIFSKPPCQTWSYVGRPRGFLLMACKPGFLDDNINQNPAFISSSNNDLTISLLPEGIIKGRVTITGGEPVGEIAVQLFSQQVQNGLARWVPGPSTKTNSAGEFRVAELQPGTYRVVTKEWMDNDPAGNVPGTQIYGFPPVYFPGVADFSAAGTIELGAGQTIQADLPIVSQPYFQVRIPVANGNARTGFNVSIEGPRSARFELGYNVQEQRIEGMLPSGNYMVRVTSFGPDSVSGTIRIRVMGAPLEAPAIMLIPNSSIPINVREEFTDTTWTGPGTVGGISLHGPRLYLQASIESADDFEQRGGSIRPSPARNDDALVIESVPPGRYWLHLSTSRGYVASATLGSTDLLHQPFMIASGAGAPIEVTLRDDGAELDGTVASSSDHNASGDSSVTRAWVYCVPLPESSGQFQETGVSDEGKFLIPMMAPGDYRILVFDRPQSRLPYRDTDGMKPYASKGLLVHLAAGQKMTVQVPIISATE